MEAILVRGRLYRSHTRQHRALWKSSGHSSLIPIDAAGPHSHGGFLHVIQAKLYLQLLYSLPENFHSYRYKEKAHFPSPVNYRLLKVAFPLSSLLGLKASPSTLPLPQHHPQQGTFLFLLESMLLCAWFFFLAPFSGFLWFLFSAQIYHAPL